MYYIRHNPINHFYILLLWSNSPFSSFFLYDRALSKLLSIMPTVTINFYRLREVHLYTCLMINLDCLYGMLSKTGIVPNLFYVLIHIQVDGILKGTDLCQSARRTSLPASTLTSQPFFPGYQGPFLSNARCPLPFVIASTTSL